MKICEYGCGQEAKYKPRKGQTRWCCNEFFMQCPKIIEISNDKKRGRTYEEMYGETDSEIKREKLSQNMKKNNPMNYMEPWNKGKTGVYSEETIKKMSKSGKGRLPWNKDKKDCFSHDVKKKMSEAKRNCIPWNKDIKNCFNKDTLNIMRRKAIERMKNPKNRSKIKNKIMLSCKEYRVRWPFLFIIEELKDGPNKNFFSRCKNHNCPNSKEKDGWFLTTRSQIEERRRQIYYGNGGSYLYCSKRCKHSCPLWNMKKDPFEKVNKKEIYENEEYQTFRQFVLERDNNECQFCGKQAEQVHHERPQKLEPFFALDPDFAWSVCKECHFKYGHKDDCSTGKLANLICEEK